MKDVVVSVYSGGFSVVVVLSLSLVVGGGGGVGGGKGEDCPRVALLLLLERIILFLKREKNITNEKKK